MLPDALFLTHAAWGFAATLGLALLVWIASLLLRDVSIVDIAWGAMVVAPLAVLWLLGTPAGPRALPVAVVALAWALRLSGYIAWRHRGEDARYVAIRQRNAPHFAWKSVYLIFGFQAVLAWVVSWPLLGAHASPASLTAWDVAGLLLACAGLTWEVVADAQLARFKADPAQRGAVMDRGLWRYSRHPNYFGECCLWWGLFVVAAAGGAWWSVASPLVMTVLLLRVSGVTLLESTIVERRPAYADYVRRTNAFFPGSPRS